MVEILPAIPLAERRPLSDRVGLPMIHPDREGVVGTVAISPDGKRIIGGTYPGNTIQTWDAETGKQLVTIETRREGKANSEFWTASRDFTKIYGWIETAGDSERVKVGGEYARKISYPDSGVFVWDIASGNVIDKFQYSPPTQFRYMSISPGETHMITNELMSGTFVDDQPYIRRMTNLKTREWIMMDDNVGVPFFNQKGTQCLLFTLDEAKRNATGLSIQEFPSFRETSRAELPAGLYGGSSVLFTSDGKHVIVSIKRYERERDWKSFKTSIYCFELASGKQIGKYDYPFDNQSLRFASKQMSDGSLVITTGRDADNQIISLQVPEMVATWQVDMGDYAGVQGGKVSVEGEWAAFICQGASRTGETYISISSDLNLFPQPDLKIIGKDGTLLETIVLPVGAVELELSDDGMTAAIGAQGAAYRIDLSRPFANEEK